MCLLKAELLNISIWPIDRSISCFTKDGQNEAVSNDNEGILHVSQRFRETVLPL